MEAIAEVIAQTPENKAHYHINPSNAADLARLRWQKHKDANDTVQNAVRLALAEAKLAGQIPIVSAREDESEELKNAREQVAKLSMRLDNALSDPKTPPIDIERLQRSLSSAREDERKLSGRSLPPTLKAGPSKPQRQRAPMSDPT